MTKAKFTSGEKILCFEPDPTKVKILYEAKILEVQTALGPSGKKRNEFLVHFQGWNSSWDRYVLEDMVLKDNTENRALQDQLDKESVEQEKLAKKLLKKKKMERRLFTGDGAGGMLDDPEDTEIKFKKEANTESVSDAETDTETEPSNSPGIKLEDRLLIKEEEGGEEEAEEGEEEEMCHEVAPLVISEGLKRKLEQDHILVSKKKRLVQLPAQPNIVHLLEMFVRDFAFQRLAQLEKQVSRQQYGARLAAEKEAEKYEEAVDAIELCKEVAEGLRIIVDFQLGKLLLYPTERHQFSQARNLKPVLREGRGKSKEEEEVERGFLGTPVPATTSGRRRKRTGCSLGEEEGGLAASIGSTSTGTGSPTLATPCPTSSRSQAVLAAHIHSWRLVPESFHFQDPVPSSLVYGGIHLARLLVKLPSILGNMKFTTMSAKNVHKYLELIESFLASQTDIFVEESYK